MRIAAALAVLVSLAQVTLADTITADATGPDSSFTSDFWGVSFDVGDGFVESVSFDLTADSDAFFDFDGSAFGGATSPVLNHLVGLTMGDITVTSSGGSSHPSVVTFSFASKSFGAGDSFRFSADTDALGIGIPDPGSVIADSGVTFSVFFEDGRNRTVGFESISDDVALAVVQSPEPGTWAGLLLALGFFAWRSRRKQTAS